MATTFTVEQEFEVGNIYFCIGTLTITGTYVTGGDAVAVSGPSKLERIDVLDVQGGRAGLVPDWDRANQKLKWFTSNGAAPAALAELANAGTQTGASGAVALAWGQ
jgi:hypothetical protein